MDDSSNDPAQTRAVYDQLPDSAKVVPAFVRVMEQKLLSKHVDCPIACTVVAQSHIDLDGTLESGLVIKCLSFYCKHDDSTRKLVWRVAREYCQHIVTADSIEVAWAVFFDKVTNWRTCLSCGCNNTSQSFVDDMCIDCAARDKLLVKIRCPICTVKRSDIYRLRCGHSLYCKPCLTRNLNHKCPSCRAGYEINTGFTEDDYGDEDDEANE